jgi:hypothetical protein
VGQPARRHARPEGAAPTVSGRPALRLLLIVVVGVGATAALRAGAPSAEALGSVIAVEQPAPASDGWGPLYVDENGAPARWDPCTPIHYVVQPGWIPAAGAPT